MSYEIVNTETHEVLGIRETLEDAEREMLRMFPVIEPWDGVVVNIAIREVCKHRALIHDMTQAIIRYTANPREPLTPYLISNAEQARDDVRRICERKCS